MTPLGGWRVGDPPAARRFVDVGPLETERGATLPAVTVAYETWGTPRLHDGVITNAVLVEHALTGDAHVAGDAGPGQPTPGWWGEVVQPGGALDTDTWFVVCSNVLGGCQGTTGPSSPGPDGRAWGSRFPMITIRDQVEVEQRLADRLGIARFAAVLGGSMGGMRALEWALLAPERVGALLLLAVGAEATADQLGTQSTQVHAITSDPHWHAGDYLAHDAFPAMGLGTARRIAHLTYRAELELDQRFGRAPQPGGRFEFAIQSYLDHHADKLVGRFDPGSYVILSEAMNSHDVGRGRGGVDAALSMIDIPTVVAGIDSDRLYPLRLQAQLAAAIPTCSGLQVISSPFGHDGFLIETEAVGAAVRETLARSPGSAPSS